MSVGQALAFLVLYGHVHTLVFNYITELLLSSCSRVPRTIPSTTVTLPEEVKMSCGLQNPRSVTSLDVYEMCSDLGKGHVHSGTIEKGKGLESVGWFEPYT